VTMKDGLDHVVSRDCPGMDITSLTTLQRECGSQNQLRFYKEDRIHCSFVAETPECPLGRKNNHFPGVKFGLFEPGTPSRNLVAWSRFESCQKWGCQEREVQSASCRSVSAPFPHPVHAHGLLPHPVHAHGQLPPRPVTVKSTYHQVKTAGQCCRGDSIDFSGDGYSKTPAGCEVLCNKNPACRYFDHSTTWNNCYLCADCDDGNSDQAAYAWFTSWAKARYVIGGGYRTTTGGHAETSCGAVGLHDIVNYEECQSAAQKVGIAFSKIVGPGSWSHVPYGCTVQQGTATPDSGTVGANRIHYSTTPGDNNAGAGGYLLICKQPTPAPPPTPAQPRGRASEPA